LIKRTIGSAKSVLRPSKCTPGRFKRTPSTKKNTPELLKSTLHILKSSVHESKSPPYALRRRDEGSRREIHKVKR